MTVKVRFFASLRERVGRSEVDVETVADVPSLWAAITDLPLDPHLRVAINHEYAGHDSAVADGDEVAFFPPVTGG